ncbi:MAG: hypothetical protein CVU24_09630 [Betaproteobacteria bacterium HGW-Betaproteobacteria-18]|nr:MAG: hypothetical protein CVU24_09630 [Betaproteobacteria bacterium HGW-Betaproteobacteria-18]
MKINTFNYPQSTVNSEANFRVPSAKILHGKTVAKFDQLTRSRLSKNFILRDFLFCTASAAQGLSNFPENPDTVIKAGHALCDRLLEPILAHFGRFAITYGYQSRESMDCDLAKFTKLVRPNCSSPHHWDRFTFGDDVYARIDILPFCVEDGEVDKIEFGNWLMHNLDIDLCMTWTRSNVFCLTIGPMPRRCWVQWGRPALDEPKQQMLMGADYWQRVYPALPESQRPKYGPSFTGGSMHWRGV